MPCEQTASLIVAGLHAKPFPLHTKDCLYHSNNPFAENLKNGRQILSIPCFQQTFTASESLSRLHRLNI